MAKYKWENLHLEESRSDTLYSYSIDVHFENRIHTVVLEIEVENKSPELESALLSAITGVQEEIEIAIDDGLLMAGAYFISDLITVAGVNYDVNFFYEGQSKAEV